MRFPEDESWWDLPLRIVGVTAAILICALLVLGAVAFAFNLCRWAFVQIG